MKTNMKSLIRRTTMLLEKEGLIEFDHVHDLDDLHSFYNSDSDKMSIDLGPYGPDGEPCADFWMEQRGDKVYV